MKARLLLGWMTAEAAVELLQSESSSPMGRTEAESRWAGLREYVLAMAPRAPARSLQPVTGADDLTHAAKFNAYLRARSQAAVAKRADLRTLCVHQLSISLEHSSAYQRVLRNRYAWNEMALPTRDSHSTIEVTGGVNGLGRTYQVRLPHGEFDFACDDDGAFRVHERMRYVSVAELADRTVLWAGYHRVFAMIAGAGPGASAQAMVARISTPAELRSSATADHADPCGVYGTRPPVMADFFDPKAYLDVDVRERSYVMNIQARHAIEMRGDSHAQSLPEDPGRYGT